MSLRPSVYTVVSASHFRHPSGRVVRPVFHAATARAYLVDLATAARLCGTAGSTDPAMDDRLAAAGLLVEDERDEAAEVIDAGRAAARDRRVREFVVMPSAYCNMGCGYCGQSHERVTVSRDHRAALAGRVERAAQSGHYDSINVRWFGGEPMMGYAVLRDLSQRFVASAAHAGVGYTAKIITNGSLLDARKLRVLHRDCRVGTVEITLDGPREVHDAARPLKRGGGSFERVVAVVAAALDDPELGDLRFVIRTNVTVDNAGLAEPFAAELAAAGLAHDRVSCYPAPVHAWGNDVGAMAVPRREMAAAELRWFLAYARRGLRFALLPSAARRVVCSATTRHSEVVGADGRVFSCTEQPLVPGLGDGELGTVAGVGAALRPAGAFDDWYDAMAAGETGCRACSLLPVCGGACPKLWREGSPPCPSLRDNLPDRLDLYALTAGATPI
ncbi:radical SAM protein [Actinoplanes sp. N902-109]|uniref:radical SAM/SPASM domain-containing protein n=1 Tax=Actinoplanes sp. (strain N902-109) TaxID=649831 RepID=UPI0003293780|nr:radical SAM protein [Actinoplanes sp. N902-109]AGL17742.1 Radical SAM domain-containing protein [Actinoplanes sp. N902-109]